MANREQDLRIEILNTLLMTPHRQLDLIYPVHQELIEKDPLFYVRLAAWYADHGDVRDHQEIFVVCLVLSNFPGHREVGLALLRNLPPYQVGRVVDFIHGRTTKRKVSLNASHGLKQAIPETPGTVEPAAEEPQVQEEIIKTGLGRNLPRSVKTEVTRYLREREADVEWFDGTVLNARKSLKRLYALLHIAPGARAQQVLFDEEPPQGSRLFALKQLAKAESPTEQAEAIIAYQIPYRVASSVVKQMTPTVLLALIERMSAQELINNIGSLKKRGVFDQPELKALVEDKLEKAKSAKRVSAYKAEEAIKAADVSEDLKAKLHSVTDAQIKAKGKITRDTALLVDKSSSMSEAIELGKQLGSMISTICEGNLFVYAFDTVAYEIHPQGKELKDWERAFAGITAGGSTSCGAPVAVMQRKQQSVEQIIMVTDEGENTYPLFNTALDLYKGALKVDPSIVLVRTPGGGSYLENQCRQRNLMVDVFQFSGDYYSLPNLIPLLSRPSKLELLMEILEYPLPQRKAA